MKILFRIGEANCEGDARDLSALGAFVVSERPCELGDLELALETGSDLLRLSGEVVRTTDEGFAVAFRALPPQTLTRLDWLLHPEREPRPDEMIEQTEQQTSEEHERLEIQGQDWSPPVSEPALHEWRPEKDFTHPPPQNATGGGWESLPTISPTITPTAAVERAAEHKPASAGQPEGDVARVTSPAPTAQHRAPAAEGPLPPATTGQPQAARGEVADDKRQSVRLERSIPVTFDNLTGLIKEFTHNISYGGMFVYSSQFLPQNAQTAITLIHPVHGERLTLPAKVVHTNQAPVSDPRTGEGRYGLGLEFCMPLAELKQLLADFIGSHQQRGEPPALQVVSAARALLERGAQSHHALLGIAENASADVVRQAYFKWVDQFHPDRYFGKVNESDRKLLEELFRRLTKAYEELTA